MQPVNTNTSNFLISSAMPLDEKKENKILMEVEKLLSQTHQQMTSLTLSSNDCMTTPTTNKTKEVTNNKLGLTSIQNESVNNTALVQQPFQGFAVKGFCDRHLRMRPVKKNDEWQMEQFPDFDSSLLVQNSRFDLSKKTLIQLSGQLVQQIDFRQIVKLIDTLKLIPTEDEKATVYIDLSDLNFVRLTDESKMKELKEKLPNLVTKEKKLLLPCRLASCYSEEQNLVSKNGDKSLEIFGACRFPLEPKDLPRKDQLPYFSDYMKAIPDPLKYQILPFTDWYDPDVGSCYSTAPWSFTDPAFFRFCQGMSRGALNLCSPAVNKFAHDLVQNIFLRLKANSLNSPFDSPEELDLIRENVTELSFWHENLNENPEFLDLIACFFPHLKTLRFQPDTALCLGHLKNFKNLECLDLSRAKISDNDLALFAQMNLQNLKTIIFTDTSIQGQGLSYLPSSIRTLDLGHCEGLREENLSCLQKFTELENLDLTFTNISGKCLNYLPLSLRQLKLGHCNLNDDNLVTLESFKKLELLDLTGAKISAKALEFIPPSVQNLCLCFCNKITDDSFVALQHYKALEKLNLSYTNISEKGLRFIPQSVKELDLTMCEKITDDTLACLQQCTKLQTLNLSYTDITGKGLSFIPSSVRELTLTCCSKITDDALAPLKQLPLLEKLTLRTLDIVGKGLCYLPSSIDELDLFDCKKITDDSLAFLKDLKELQKLDLSLMNITGKGLGFVPQSVNELNLWGCKKITDDDLAFLKQLHGLQKLNLRSTEFSGKGFVHLPPSLLELDLTDGHQKLVPGNLANLNPWLIVHMRTCLLPLQEDFQARYGNLKYLHHGQVNISTQSLT